MTPLDAILIGLGGGAGWAFTRTMIDTIGLYVTMKVTRRANEKEIDRLQTVKAEALKQIKEANDAQHELEIAQGQYL